MGGDIEVSVHGGHVDIAVHVFGCNDLHVDGAEVLGSAVVALVVIVDLLRINGHPAVLIGAPGVCGQAGIVEEGETEHHTGMLFPGAFVFHFKDGLVAGIVSHENQALLTQIGAVQGDAGGDSLAGFGLLWQLCPVALGTAGVHHGIHGHVLVVPCCDNQVAIGEILVNAQNLRRRMVYGHGDGLESACAQLTGLHQLG